MDGENNVMPDRAKGDRMKPDLRQAGKVLAAACVLAAASGGVSAAEQSVTYENTIRKIVADRCLGCHGANSPSLAEFNKDKKGWAQKFKGPRMDSYANLVVFVNGSDAGAVMRRLDDGKNTKDGKPGNMYNYLGSTDAERAQRLEQFRKWVGNWTLKRRKELTTSELAAIKVPEK
jgi:mono/diheme cytochrome c family protein